MQPAATMERPAVPATTGNEQKELKLAGAFDLNEDEVKAGMDDGGLGYLDQYPYLVKLEGDEFHVVDMKSEQVVWKGKELPCIIFYGHSVYRLTRGAVHGVIGRKKDWPADMKEIVAMSYGSPFGDSKGGQGSRGNFDANGFAQYIDNKEMRKDVEKRLYIFMQLPKSVNGGALAAGTFGATSLIPFSAYHARIKGLNAPLALVRSILKTEKSTNEAGDTFNALTFEPIFDEKGNVAVTVKNTEDYRTKVKPTVDKIIETHQYVMKRLETSGPAAATPVGAKSSQETSARKIAAPAGNAAAFSPSPGESDAIPSGMFSDDDLNI